ncbi:MAG: LysM peptidoglycan-binding domain-containing protein [Chloroflexi bacterium]|nr:LysM peptidoglycan-binding domain-containing protein [Chloroflexota bacterium]
MNRRAWLVALLINAGVSLSITLLVLWWWERTHPLPTLEAPLVRPGGPADAEAPQSAGGFAYVVQEGDRLPALAKRFGVDVQQLRTINHLVTDDLQPGQVLIIPGTPPPTTQGDPKAVHVVGVLGAGVLADEHVRLQYQGQAPINLQSWTLEDEDGHRFVFPSLVLYPQGAVNVWTKPGTNTVIHLYWGLTQAIWEPGETLTLRDAQGQVVTTYVVPQASQDQ